VLNRSFHPSEREIVHRVLVVVATALVSVLVAAPASAVDKQNGEAKRSPARVLADASVALSDLSSFKVAGSIRYQGKMVNLDVVATAGQGGGGTLQATGRFEFVVAAPNVYFRGDSTYWTKDQGADRAQADLVAGRWFRTTAASKDLGNIAQFVDVKHWSPVLYPADGSYTKGSQRTFRGAPVVAVHDGSKPPATVLVAATGKPYPLAILPDNRRQGGLVFSSFDSASPPTVPTGATDVPNS
jgi:hypothetical protein